ncbi:MAG: hypothetical protein IJ740_09080 [Ruminococcus sp.]|nr:hypothetical protein [Synergistaceae bacterium]MBR1603724.1 hypothetical protein [Synergistaceae bacterium]MBR1751014.1 hypothetical protein [Ruminococcus sp.]
MAKDFNILATVDNAKEVEEINHAGQAGQDIKEIEPEQQESATGQVEQDAGRVVYRKVKAATPNGERKTRRVYSLIRPSTYEALERAAYVRGVSVNEMINTILEEFINRA